MFQCPLGSEADIVKLLEELMSRNGNDFSARFPSMASALSKLPDEIAFKPVLSVLAMKANIDLVTYSFDKRRQNRIVFGGLDRSLK